MAAEERDSADLVAFAERLAAQAKTLRFFPLVALLERLLPEAARAGASGPVAEEAIRFRHDPALAFSAGDVASVALRQTEADPEDFRSQRRSYFEVTTTFLGLTGSGTPLPYYIAEEVAQEDPDRPHRREFLDLFHHRLLALLYRARARYDVATDHTADGTDAWSRRLLALAGVDAYDRPPPPGFTAAQLLRLAPLLAARARTPRTLELALQDVLADVLDGGTVKVTEFVGQWSPIDLADRTRLGQAGSRLGSSFVVGSRTFDKAGAFEIELGPVGHATYRRFLPGGDLTARIDATVALFTRDAPEHVLQVLLREDAVPRVQLGQRTQAGLGRDTWLGARTGRATRVRIPVHPERRALGP